MPDLTPKPFRSRANAIINLMGAVGGMIYLGIAAVLYSQKRLCRDRGLRRRTGSTISRCS